MANCLYSSSLWMVPPENHLPSAQAWHWHPRILPLSQSHVYYTTQSCPWYGIPYSWNGLFLSMSIVLSIHPNHWNSLLTGFSVYAFTTSTLSFRLKSENANLIKFSAQNSSLAPHCQAVKPTQLQWVHPKPLYLKVAPLHFGILLLSFLIIFPMTLVFIWDTMYFTCVFIANLSLLSGNYTRIETFVLLIAIIPRV